MTAAAPPPERPMDDEDGVKRQLREALERKRAHQAEANARMRERGTAKIGSAHGPARRRRSFRRKSG